MRDDISQSKLLGYVQLRVGQKVYAVPVQAVKFDRDAGSEPGGFFAEGTQLGILVDSEASARDVQEQIMRASADAVRHLTKQFLN